MDKFKTVAIPCANPYCRFNWVMPFWVALNILIVRWEILCPVCRQWTAEQIDKQPDVDDGA